MKMTVTFACPACSAKRFTSLSQAKAHTDKMHKDQLIETHYQCKECPKSYTRKHDLKRHYMKLHRAIPVPSNLDQAQTLILKGNTAQRAHKQAQQEPHPINTRSKAAPLATVEKKQRNTMKAKAAKSPEDQPKSTRELRSNKPAAEAEKPKGVTTRAAAKEAKSPIQDKPKKGKAEKDPAESVSTRITRARALKTSTIKKSQDLVSKSVDRARAASRPEKRVLRSRTLSIRNKEVKSPSAMRTRSSTSRSEAPEKTKKKRVASETPRSRTAKTKAPGDAAVAEEPVMTLRSGRKTRAQDKPGAKCGAQPAAKKIKLAKESLKKEQKKKPARKSDRIANSKLDNSDKGAVSEEKLLPSPTVGSKRARASSVDEASAKKIKLQPKEDSTDPTESIEKSTAQKLENAPETEPVTKEEEAEAKETPDTEQDASEEPLPLRRPKRVIPKKQEQPTGRRSQGLNMAHLRKVWSGQIVPEHWKPEESAPEEEPEQPEQPQPDSDPEEEIEEPQDGGQEQSFYPDDASDPEDIDFGEDDDFDPEFVPSKADRRILDEEEDEEWDAKDWQKENRHQCNLCGEGFRTKKALKAHSKEAHGGRKRKNGVKIVACPTCPETFPSRLALNSHTRLTHTTHSCHLCNGLVFESLDALREHQQTRHVTFSCPRCAEVFLTWDKMKGHEARAHAVFPCFFPNCTVSAFATEPERVYHVRNAHNIKPLAQQESSHARNDSDVGPAGDDVSSPRSSGTVPQPVVAQNAPVPAAPSLIPALGNGGFRMPLPPRPRFALPGLNGVNGVVVQAPNRPLRHIQPLAANRNQIVSWMLRRQFRFLS